MESSITASENINNDIVSSQINPVKKEIKSFVGNVSIKEEDGEFYSEGFIATTHPDRAFDPDLGVEGDILSKTVMQQICDYINSTVASIKGVGSTRTVSDMHDWVKERNPDLPPAGMAVPPAEVKEYVDASGKKDGHWGVFVKTHHNKNHPRFKEIIYEVEHGYMPGYSIEYEPGDFEKVKAEGKMFRFLKSIQNFVGYAFASARKIANPHAVITGMSYKEIEDSMAKAVVNEEVKEVSEEVKMAEETIPEAPVEVKEVPAPEVKTVEDVVVKETKEIDLKEVISGVVESKEFREAIDALKVENKTLKNTVEEPKMDITVKEMQEALDKKDMYAYKEAAAKYNDEVDIFTKAINDPANYTRGFQKNLQVKVSGKGLVLSGGIQQKSTLVVGTNAGTATQANVEFADVFAPGIIDTFNNQTNLFGFLKKEQHVGGSHYQWKMVTNKDPQSYDTFQAQNSTTVQKGYSTKLNYQTPLKIARRGISVSDFMQRYSARSLMDLFSMECDLQMKEMMNDVNAALFAAVADGTGNAPLGLEAVANSGSYTTLYGLTRYGDKTSSLYNALAPDTATDNYTASTGALTEPVLRTAIRYLETEGTRFGDIAIVCSPYARDQLFNLLDGNRRFNTVEATFGFNKANIPSYDGVPIIADSDCTADSLFVIDTSSEGAVIVIGQAPTLTNLAKVGAAVDAFVQMDFAFVYKQPRRIAMLNGITATS